MPRPYPREFRDDVVRVARNREDGVTIEQIATDFGVAFVPGVGLDVDGLASQGLAREPPVIPSRIRGRFELNVKDASRDPLTHPTGVHGSIHKLADADLDGIALTHQAGQFC